MLSTVPGAVVEPKGKLQNPAARAKRLKGLRTNPDFIEAVQEERAAAKKDHGDYMTPHGECIALQNERLACQDKAIDILVLQKEYIDELKEKNKLYKVIEDMGRNSKLQDEMTETLERTIKDQSEIIELNKKARNPNRVTSGKRGRPKGSKSKSVAFGADAMPDSPITTW
jgi:hypothetical protein